MKKEDKNEKLVCSNKRASFDYFLSDFLEVGIVLVGTEIKSLREGHGSLSESYVYFKNGEAYISGFNISTYKQGNIFNHDPLRNKKLLMHRLEILRFSQAVERKGYTVVATKCYISGGRAKLQIALAKGKNTFDKRETLKKKEAERRVEAYVKTKSKY